MIHGTLHKLAPKVVHTFDVTLSQRGNRAMADPYGWVSKSLETLHRANWYRQVQAVEGICGPVVRVNGRSMVNLASNDYLGFAGDARLIEAAISATQAFGTGATGSRLLSGHRALHSELEGAIATLKKTEDAIVFSSGYLANIGTIAALVNNRDLVLADEYNHSSLKNGAGLSGARVVEYNHCELLDLADKLKEHRASYRRCLILSDGVFGMDGDVCPLPEILNLAEQFEAMVMIDEAHSAGVLGETGAGCVEYFGCGDLPTEGLRHRPVVQMGTLSKAFASLGGYVAGSAELIDFLRNRAVSWIYTTGLSPADTAAALGAVSMLAQEPWRLIQLNENARYLEQQIDNVLLTLSDSQCQHFKRLPSDSAIVCLQVKDAATVLHLGKRLKERGAFVSAVRPPTVPVSRLRMSVMATHTRAHLDQFVLALRDALIEAPLRT